VSPQLNRWVYGFFQHSFSQTKRGDGFRPTVFMTHGLAVAVFTMTAVVAAAGLFKTKIRVFRIPAGWTLAYLWLILLLSKSVAAFLYSLIAVPLILFTSPKTQSRAAILLAIVILSYPDARGADVVPIEEIRGWVASNYDEQKVSSIMTRFDNETELLERANERPSFGWGKFGRASIYSYRSGKKESVRDGDWIITWGEFGRVGFFGKYLLLLLPIFLTGRKLKYVRRKSDRQLLATLSLIVGFAAFDFLPNGNFNYLAFVLSGALMGCCEGVLRHDAWRARLRQEQATVRQNAELAPDATARSVA
jgi:hypothetical protein